MILYIYSVKFIYLYEKLMMTARWLTYMGEEKKIMTELYK